MSNLEIQARSVTIPESIENQIHKYFAKIKRRINNKILACNVVINTAKNHAPKSKIYNIKVEVLVSGKKFITKKQNHHLIIAIRDGFSSTQHLLEKYLEKNVYYFNRKMMHCNDSLPVDTRKPLTA